MLDTKCTFDIHTDILAYITTLNREKNDSGHTNSVRVIGQEQDGCLLYTWASNQHNAEKDAAQVTQVGVYDPVKKTNKTLFVHESLVEIVNCSVNQERTFLGFVTVEQTYISEGYGRKLKHELYKAYLTEVATSLEAPSRVFYLNLERPNYLRLQFLYGSYQGQVARREAHLLVILHTESIGLYHIPMARVGADGVIVGGEPKKEQIFQKRFIWSQWDATHQRLYVVQFRRHSKMSPSHKLSMSGTHRAFLTAYQFTETTANQFMLDVPLDLPFPKLNAKNHRSFYEQPGPHDCIPDIAINMHIITHNNGTMCICLQHPSTKSTSVPVSKPPAGSETRQVEEHDEQTIQYSIAMLHHGRTLTCSGLRLARDKTQQPRILFIAIGDYLAVHLPHHFTHLLNVGVDLEPCHHILSHDAYGTNVFGDFDENGCLLPLVWDRHASGLSSGPVVYNTYTSKAYRIGVNHEALISLFTESISPATRLAVLHYSVIHQRDLALTRMLFESLLSDTASPELIGLMEEFLVGSTYASLRCQMELYVMRFMPFTCASTFRGQTESLADGSRACTIKYTTIGPVSFGSLSRMKTDHQAAEMWHNLLAVCSSRPIARFNSRLVQHHLEASEEDNIDFVKVNPEEVPSLIQKLATAAKSALASSRPSTDTASSDKLTNARHPSRSEVLLGQPPAFLSTQISKPDPHQEQMITLTGDLLRAHLKRVLKRDSRSKIRCLVSDYITVQMQQSRQLAHIVCTLLVPHDTPNTQTLSMLGSAVEHSLFQCMERYHLALAQRAFPQPLGFPLYLTCLAYRCLPFSVFNQYVDSQVLQVKSDFMKKLITEVPDSAETVPIKMAVLQMMSPTAAIACARRWHHPTSHRFLATHYIEACIDEGERDTFVPVYSNIHTHNDHLTENMRSAAQTTSHGVGFPPLTSLITSMEKKALRKAGHGKPGMEYRFLEEVTLAELYAGGCNQEDILTFG